MGCTKLKYQNFSFLEIVHSEKRVSEEKKRINYYPFGAGPRMCVGNNFAMAEMIIAIAEIVKKFQISSSLASVEINPLISLKPKCVPLLFKER
ncbi:cytochrome P450 [Arenibacter sp. TNZ]|uniref:cytochrome P450 n=1 Tax=Arenibacter TaxID=178469 RepID=UPI000CD3BFFD|nr:cytochrome P450 [Arenibacter catalasegens]MCM4173559.1 cytochrome P450 [Arenibacter sp. TNZ]